MLRIWVVDDNSQLRELFGKLLNTQPGIRCTRWFASAEAVLATLAEERPPDMILLDINMGGQSGLAAIQPIRKIAPSVKVVMWTMFTNSRYEAEAFNAGASGFLLKSYEASEIVALLHEASRNPRAPALFPNLAFNRETRRTTVAEIKSAGAKTPPRRFSLAGAFRQLCGGGARRSTESAT
jgi:DNA-binding NarL/FixJ family response regulator